MAEKKKGTKDRSIEEVLTRLKKINEQLASENLPLEEALTFYAEGAELVAESMKKLENAKLRMEEITLVMEKNEGISEEMVREPDEF